MTSVNHDPFTLDLFGSSALSSGLRLGVTAFGGYDLVAANDDDTDPTPPSPSPVPALGLAMAVPSPLAMN
jgi:hypothetical protein